MVAGALQGDLKDTLLRVGGRNTGRLRQLVAERTAMIVTDIVEPAKILGEHSHRVERFKTRRIVAVRGHVMR